MPNYATTVSICCDRIRAVWRASYRREFEAQYAQLRMFGQRSKVVSGFAADNWAPPSRVVPTRHRCGNRRSVSFRRFRYNAVFQSFLWAIAGLLVSRPCRKLVRSRREECATATNANRERFLNPCARETAGHRRNPIHFTADVLCATMAAYLPGWQTALSEADSTWARKSGHIWPKRRCR
jgi:hypothetical protein